MNFSSPLIEMRDKKGEKREKNIIIMVISENELTHAWTSMQIML